MTTKLQALKKKNIKVLGAGMPMNQYNNLFEVIIGTLQAFIDEQHRITECYVKADHSERVQAEPTEKELIEIQDKSIRVPKSFNTYLPGEIKQIQADALAALKSKLEMMKEEDNIQPMIITWLSQNQLMVEYWNSNMHKSNIDVFISVLMKTLNNMDAEKLVSKLTTSNTQTSTSERAVSESISVQNTDVIGHPFR